MSVELRLTESFDLWDDLAAILDDGLVSKKLSVPSNTIWDQLWCVVGARESYTRAIRASGWQGFSCSLTGDQRGGAEPLAEGLGRSRREVDRVLGTAEEDLILDLLLHETQHQGQLIRFLYGLDLDFPPSWKRRWSLG